MAGETLLELLTGNVPLVEGNRYVWSGQSEGLYTITRWNKVPCKLISISETSVTVFDINDRKRYTYNIDSVRSTSIRIEI